MNKIIMGLIMVFFSACQQADTWTYMLDGELSQWDMYLSYRHRDDYRGEMPADTNGIPLSPVGYNKNVDGVFSVDDSGGTPVLRISGEIYGCVFTKKEYENYHLKMKVKWGDMKYVPRLEKLKDSGILYHSQGECGVDYWRSWMLGQEFQVMEGHMGDYWSIANSAIDIKAFIPEGSMNAVASPKQPFLYMGTGSPYSGFCLRSADYESDPGEWTILELICFEGHSLHIVNGHVVMILRDSRYVADGRTVPLTKGKIQLQSEAAEVFYKDIMIRNITELPQKYKAFFTAN